eukprot:Em0008g1088a
MSRLHEQLKYFVNQKLNSDPSWQRLKVILSGHVADPMVTIVIHWSLRSSGMKHSCYMPGCDYSLHPSWVKHSHEPQHGAKLSVEVGISVSPVVLLLAVCRAVCRGVHPGGTDVELNWMFAKRNQDVSCYGDVLVCLSNRLFHMSDSNWCFSPAAIAQLDMFISRFPRMFEYLNSNPKDDMYYEADLFPEPDGCTSLSPSVASGLKAGHQPGVLEATANIWIGSQWIASQIATIETVVPDMQANDKFHRIEALQYKVLIQHQALVCPGEEGLAGRRQHCQQLLVGQERGAQLKLHVEAIACMSFMSETNGV